MTLIFQESVKSTAKSIFIAYFMFPTKEPNIVPHSPTFIPTFKKG
jgi:hypothetical protein